MIPITIVLAYADRQYVTALEVPAGTGARQALRLAVADGFDISRLQTTLERVELGVFGRRVDDARPLTPGDRLELYRPLHQDPMELRRRRARQSRG